VSPDRLVPPPGLPDPNRIADISRALVGLLVECGDQVADEDGDLLDDLREPLTARAGLDVGRGDINAAVTLLKIAQGIRVRTTGSKDQRLTRSRIIGLGLPLPKETSDES
jgi:hypothetical protein